MLPKGNARKGIPLYTFLTQYFPNALIEVTKVAVAGSVQHHPGQPVYWEKGKSMDQLNTAVRHIFDHGMGHVYDDEPPEVLAAINAEEGDQHPTMHLAKAAWRLLAEIELICEARELGIPVDELVRGTHEFRGLVEEPKYPDVSDYTITGKLLDSVSDDGIWRAAELAHDPVAPVGTGPLEPMPMDEAQPRSQLPTPTVVIPMLPVQPPRGRLLHCGCFSDCKGHETSARDPSPKASNARGPKDPAGKPYLSDEPYRADEWEQPDMASRVHD